MGRIEFGTWNLARQLSGGTDIYDGIPESEFVNSEFRWACSSVRLERTPDKREVDGSTPSRPTTEGKEATCYTKVFLVPSAVSLRGCSSAGRAPALHAGGHRFEPVHLHHLQIHDKIVQ